jgi:hypothetical protein
MMMIWSSLDSCSSLCLEKAIEKVLSASIGGLVAVFDGECVTQNQSIETLLDSLSQQ